MVNLCFFCSKLLEDGDTVNMNVTGVYHSIPSANSFVLDKKSLKYQPGTLRHNECGESYV